jgi:hypothetical protein
MKVCWRYEQGCSAANAKEEHTRFCEAKEQATMGESSNDNQRHQEQIDLEPLHRTTHAEKRPYWQRAHCDWRFWAGVTFIFVAFFIFIISDNLALIPRH